MGALQQTASPADQVTESPSGSTGSSAAQERLTAAVGSARATRGSVAGIVAIASTALALAVGGSGFTLDWYLPLGEIAAAFTDWFIDSCGWLYGTVGQLADQALSTVSMAIAMVPDPVLAVAMVALVWAYAGIRMTAVAVATLAWVVVTGLWQATVDTFALVALAVIASAVLGYALGVMTVLVPAVRAPVFLVIDAMQTIPVFVYLLPVVLIFGPGDTAALVVTIVYATPPMVRLTELGLRGVPKGPLEGAASTGASDRQLLVDVRMPLAAASVRAGLNQTIMFAVAMSIVAAMIGASGLGDPIWRSLSRLEFGLALDGGIALVLVAILLDRLTSVTRDVSADPMSAKPTRFDSLRFRFGIAAVVVAGVAIFAGVNASLRYLDFSSRTTGLLFSLQGHVEGVVDWINLRGAVIVDPVRDSLVLYGLEPLDDLLVWMPWYLVVGLVMAMAVWITGYRQALLTGSGVILIGLMGMWQDAATTVSLVGVSTAIALAIGIPIGVLMSLDARAEAILRPVLDILQTMPIYVFIIPAVVIMGSGIPAGILATVIYTLAPSARLTCLALNSVSATVIESAESVGATRGQLLRTVRFPLGTPTILAGINQTVLMAMSMAVVASFIGAPGLGQTILMSLTQLDLAKGVAAGLSMLIMAVVVSTLLNGAVQRLRRAEHLE